MNAPETRVALRALLVEDSASDAGLIVRHLQAGGYEVASERVETAEAMNETLARGPWDIVLCDFCLPEFDAASALAALQQSSPETPFIVVSGVIVDEDAVALVRAGARDFVLKSNLSRLAAAVRRELAEAADGRERRSAQAALAASRQWHAAAIEAAADGFAALDAAGRLLEVNDALCRMTGHARSELLGRALADFVAPTDAAAGDEVLGRARTAGELYFEGRLQRSDAARLDVAVAMSHRTVEKAAFFVFVHDISERLRREVALRDAVRDSDRARLALLGVLEDQTQAQQFLRESEERLRGILEHNVAATFVFEDGLVTYANPRAGEVLGRPRDGLLGVRLLDLVAAPHRPAVAAALARLAAQAESRCALDFVALRADGGRAEIGAVFTAAQLGGRRVILCAAQDIGERKRAQQEIQRYVGQLDTAMQATLQAVAGMVELRDPYTAGHQRRVGDLAAAIGFELGLDEKAVHGLRLAGYVHDIGKISVPADMLSKPAALSPVEFEFVKEHCQTGHDVLEGVDFPWPIAEVILQHHERLDGSGYPRQLRGEQISPAARIVAVADVVESMCSHRPYRPALGIEAALQEIESGAGSRYDAAAVAACLRLFRNQAYAMSA